MKRRRRKNRLTAVLAVLTVLFALLAGFLGYRLHQLEKQLESAAEAAQPENTGDDEQPVVLMTEEEEKQKESETGEKDAEDAENAETAAETSNGEDPEKGQTAETSDGSGTAAEESTGIPGGSGIAGEEGEITGEPGGKEMENGQNDPSGEPDELLAEAQGILKTMTLEQKVNQLFFLTPEALTGAGQVTRAGDATREAVKRHPVGGLIYFEGSLQGPDQTKALLSGTKQIYADLGLPEPFLTTDEEGGTVVRIAEKSAYGVRNVGNMRDIGAEGDVSRAAEIGEYIGSYMAELGFNMDFAPVADVLTNSENRVVAKRSFGSDPALVRDMVTAESDAMLAQGVLPVWKHFPGHGATEADTHKGYAYTDKSLEELLAEDLVPYEQAGEHAPCIMAAHISLPGLSGSDLPATLSSEIITGLLRERLGYEGVVITDALNMGAIANNYSSGTAAKRAILAGCDMLLMPYDFESAYQGVMTAVQNGEITEERIDESVLRILQCKLRMGESAQDE